MEKLNEEIEKVKKEIEEGILYCKAYGYKKDSYTYLELVIGKQTIFKSLQKAKEIMQKDREDLKEKLKENLSELCFPDLLERTRMEEIIDKIFSEEGKE